MDKQRRDLIYGHAYVYVRREYGHLPMREIHWFKVLKELEKVLNVTITAEEFAILLCFFGDDEQKDHKKYLEFAASQTNRT